MAEVPDLVPTADAPLPTDSGAAFDAKAFPWAFSLNPFGESVREIGVSARDNAIDALSAAVAGNLAELDLAALAQLAAAAGVPVLFGVDAAAGVVSTQIVPDPASDAAVWQALTAPTERRLTPAHLGAVIADAIAEARAPDLAADPVTPTSGTQFLYPHGLGTYPSRAELEFECLTAEEGWSVGERFRVAGNAMFHDGANYGISVGFDATNVRVVIGAQGLRTLNANGGRGGLTPANWQFRVLVWR